MSQLLYPIFLDCINLTKDEYWKNIFENLAFGIPPYNTFFRKDNLICNVKGKEFNYKIETEIEPSLLFDKIYNYLHNILGLLSDNQIKNEELNFDNQNKNKKIIPSVIDEYCNRMKNDHKLTIDKVKRLQRYINLNILLKTELIDYIEYDDDGTIKEILGIVYKDGNIETKKYLPDKCQYDVLIENELMYDYWEKYIYKEKYMKYIE